VTAPRFRARRSDSTDAPFLSLAEAAASGLEHDHAVVLIRANVVLALANPGGIPLQAKLSTSRSDPPRRTEPVLTQLPERSGETFGPSEALKWPSRIARALRPDAAK
jgi:hypothetical protein